MAHAPCRGADPDLFYSTRDEDSSHEVYREARRVCASCPYRAACLDYAIETRETHGLWGGLSPKQRRAEIARRRTASATETRKANNAADRAARIAAAGITP
jgi:WhiB family redox-sensing transcriptional regulator